MAIELRGEAPGAKEGGGVKQVLHEIGLECEAATFRKTDREHQRSGA